MIFDKITEKITGKLEKLVIKSYPTVEEAESGRPPAKKPYHVFINPENYQLNYRVSSECGGKKPGSTGQQTKFHGIENTQLKFDFLFDDTRIIDGDLKDIFQKPNQGVFDDVKEFREMLMQYDGDAHQTPIVKLAWGTLLFIGRANTLNIQYKLFNANGEPIRAVVSVTFTGTVDEVKQAAKDKTSSPDLTHILRVKAGDTLPLMCKKVYGDPKYYLQVAEVNRLGNFRQLQPGMELVFPPIDKTTN